ncbi:MAG: hypothetical protein LIO87_09590, partial [Eubacterium sp.]|nr:hypothetical protein [Eubacterium sp.]
VPTQTPNGICAVATLEKIYDKYGCQILNRVLRLIAGTWEGELKSFSSNMMNGVAQLVVAFGEELNDDIFKEKVGRVSVKEISRNAKERRSGAAGFAEALLLAYNKNCRTKRLVFNKLYTAKK